MEEGAGLAWVEELVMYGKWCRGIVGRGERLEMSSQWEAPEVGLMVGYKQGWRDKSVVDAPSPRLGTFQPSIALADTFVPSLH